MFLRAAGFIGRLPQNRFDNKRVNYTILDVAPPEVVAFLVERDLVPARPDTLTGSSWRYPFANTAILRLTVPPLLRFNVPPYEAVQKEDLLRAGWPLAPSRDDFDPGSGEAMAIRRMISKWGHLVLEDPEWYLYNRTPVRCAEIADAYITMVMQDVEDRLVAFCCVSHTRLGESSVLMPGGLDTELFRAVAKQFRLVY